MLFPWLETKPREGKFFAQSHTATKGKSSDSNHSCPALDHTHASHPFPSSNQASRDPSGRRRSWGGAIEQVRPQGTQGLQGRGTSHLGPCFYHGGQVVI